MLSRHINERHIRNYQSLSLVQELQARCLHNHDVDLKHMDIIPQQLTHHANVHHSSCCTAPSLSPFVRSAVGIPSQSEHRTAPFPPTQPIQSSRPASRPSFFLQFADPSNTSVLARTVSWRYLDRYASSSGLNGAVFHGETGGEHGR
jgi:hypothetical protein